MIKKITKKRISEFVREQLKTNEKWALGALVKIYDFQTEDEQNTGGTNEYNNVGFTGVDGNILSSLADQYIKKGWLSLKQKAIVMKKMSKYTRQIVKISDKEKLKLMILKN